MFISLYPPAGMGRPLAVVTSDPDPMYVWAGLVSSGAFDEDGCGGADGYGV
jgi:hypothetical protein